MQLGMIGLGGWAPTWCGGSFTTLTAVEYSTRSPQAVGEFVKDQATGTASLAELANQLARPRALRLMVPAGIVDETIAELVPHPETRDILIEGGNSYYVDDIRQAQNSLCGRSIMGMCWRKLGCPD